VPASRAGTTGFALLCVLAAIARAVSWRLLRLHHEDPWEESPHLRFTLWRFLRQLGRSNFATFTVCLAFVNFSAHVAAPYFVVYQLEEVGIGYLTYTVIALAGSTTGFFTSAWWGRTGDVYGNQAVLRWTASVVSVLPISWILFPHPVSLAAANVLGAFLWAGLNISATNFLYDSVSPPKRHTCLAYFNVLNGLAVAAGPVVGAGLFELAPRMGGSGFATVFVCSAGLRLVASVTFRYFVREVRPARRVGLREVMLDLAEEGLVQVLGFFSVAPEREDGRADERPRRRWRPRRR
jgi:predicted MFS family arabinose efflux permease